MLPVAYTPFTTLFPKPLLDGIVVLWLVKVVPPSVEMLNPLSLVVAYIVFPDAYIPNTLLLPKPLAVVYLVKELQPSLEMFIPPLVDT